MFDFSLSIYEIYIAPLQENYSRGAPSPGLGKINVFRRRSQRDDAGESAVVQEGICSKYQDMDKSRWKKHWIPPGCVLRD